MDLVDLVTLVTLVILVIVMVPYISFIMNVTFLGRGAGGVQWDPLKMALLLVLKASAVGRFICSYAEGAVSLCFVSIWWLRVPFAQPWQCCSGLFCNQFSVGRAGWAPVGRVFPFVL